MKKGYIFTTVAVIIVIIGLLAILNNNFSSTEIPLKEGYKQYTNNEYGFKFQYPADFVLRGISEEGTKNLGIALVASSTATTSSTSSPISAPETVWIYFPIANDPAYNPIAKNLKDYETNYVSSQYMFAGSQSLEKRYAEVRIKSYERLNINKNNILKQEYEHGFQLTNLFDTSDEFSEANSLRYIVSKGDKMLSIKAKNVGESNSAYYEGLIGDILSTFVFTK
jgi:hypothetical protein